MTINWSFDDQHSSAITRGWQGTLEQARAKAQEFADQRGETVTFYGEDGSGVCGSVEPVWRDTEDDSEENNPSPAHSPGRTLLDLIEAKQMTMHALSKATDLPVEEVMALISGARRITTPIAELLVQHVGGTLEFWMKREKRFRDQQTYTDSFDRFVIELEVRHRRDYRNWSIMNRFLDDGRLQDALRSVGIAVSSVVLNTSAENPVPSELKLYTWPNAIDSALGDIVVLAHHVDEARALVRAHTVAIDALDAIREKGPAIENKPRVVYC